jgi:hypothetical protein
MPKGYKRRHKDKKSNKSNFLHTGGNQIPRETIHGVNLCYDTIDSPSIRKTITPHFFNSLT